MPDPFKNINAEADGPEDGHGKLKDLISYHIYHLNITQKYKHTVRNQTLDWIDTWKLYQGRRDKAVEAWAQFWLYRPDGQKQWEIKVIWDADGPDSKNPHAHYGYEIYLNGERKAGPGHVNFTKWKPSFTRDANRMHEICKGVYADQVRDYDPPHCRIDFALRLWCCGQDVEIDQSSANDQEYNESLWMDPDGWKRFAAPSFGRMA